MPGYATRYAGKLPKRLRQRFDQSVNDTDLLKLRDEISLIDSRIEDLVGRVDSGESGEAWRIAHEALKEFNLARDAGNVPDMNAALSKLTSAVNRGHSDYAAWEAIQSLVNLRKVLSEAEQKRLVLMQQMIKVEDVTFLLQKVANIIRDRVSNKQEINAIQMDIRKLLYAGEGTTKASQDDR